MTKHYAIYIPGIGDNKFGLQGLILKFWQLAGVKVTCHSMPWSSRETYQTKITRLINKIDRQTDDEYKVALIGVSAGASAALNAYMQRSNKISRLVYVCGKINGPEYVRRSLYDEQPGFEDSLLELRPNLSKLTATDKNRMLSLFSPADTTVPHKATVIPGVREVALPGFGHILAIFYTLTFGAPKVIKFIKRA